MVNGALGGILRGAGRGGNSIRGVGCVLLTVFHKLFLMPKNMNPPDDLAGTLAAATLRGAARCLE